MLFSSITFLYYFLPVVLAVYFLTPDRGKNLFLLIASLIFYGWGEPVNIVFMLLSITMHYVLGLLIERQRGLRLARVWLILAVCFSLALLGYFKYTDFFIANLNRITGLSVPLRNIVLPIGISFYTFQTMSYTIDVYRGHTKAQHNIVDLAAYVALFPQLIAGPIVRYVDVEAALVRRTHTIERARTGLGRFIIGLSKKVLLANSLGELCEVFITSGNPTILFHWMYAAAFSLQIYFDFSGYSDMAIGLGRLLGFDFLENFNYPYVARSITEFWRRWHISLGSWFRDYLYIPLGGNRVSSGRWVFNILVVWALTGFWHGAAWTFILWGLLFAVLLIIEKAWLGARLAKAPPALAHLYVLLVVTFSFVLFDAPTVSVAASRFAALFGSGQFTDVESLYYLRSYGLIFITAVIAATPLPRYAVEHLRSRRLPASVLTLAEPLFAFALLVVSTAYLVDSSFNPFLYFRF